jgi:hypothetical protein
MRVTLETFGAAIRGYGLALMLLPATQAIGTELAREHRPEAPLEDPTNGVFELQVVLRTNVATAGADLPATVLLKNIGPGRQRVPEFKYSGDFAFQVRDTNGSNIPLSLEGWERYAATVLGLTAVELDPGQSRPYDYNFGTFFDFPATGGVFTLRAIRARPPMVYPKGSDSAPVGTLMLTSPPVTFTLLPDPWAFENTNGLFVTYRETANSRRVTKADIEAITNVQESLPANKDSEGHWGNVVEGFQLSLRLGKKSVKPGEPINVTVLLRNTTNRVVGYSAFFGSGVDLPICDFVVTRRGETNSLKKVTFEAQRISGGARWFNLHPQTQRKYETTFSAQFDLSTPGTYWIYAAGRVPRMRELGLLPDGPSVEPIRSATAEFVIEQKQ